ncbi:alpha/beta hydrolase-fold protein [Corynebacterium sp.]|uniref:alpha/beta hydrolase-fold protein n=1 Tax=Corynebacterium sp. TaxID=1720 RepID=UPI00054DA871|nr:alpha/beta hydrolase-fold protein [Corynebacterium sp.]
MIEFIREIPLTGTWPEVVTWAVILAVLSALFFALPSDPPGRRWRAVLWSLAVTVVLTGAGLAVLMLGTTTPWSEIGFRLLLGASALILAANMAGWCVGASIKKSWTILLVALLAVGAVAAANQSYELYQDVGEVDPVELRTFHSVDELPKAPAVPLKQWRGTKHPDLPAEGSMLNVSAPKKESGFHARDLRVYLPPAWFSSPRPQLPVLVLLAGIPGDPDQWFDSGQATEIARRYQQQHGGVAPIIISADATGGTWENPVCTDSNKGKVQTFLTVDLPRWAQQHLSPNPDQHTWTIGGLSYGGTCAFQVITNHPDSYGSFVNISGERTPDDGTSHESTVQNFFGGSEDKFKAQNPEDLLKKRTYPRTAGMFIAGRDDSSAKTALKHLQPLAVAAKMQASYHEISGAHNFKTWRGGLNLAFPFIVRRGGLES